MRFTNDEIKALITEARIDWFCTKCGFAYDLHENRNRIGEPIANANHPFVGSLVWRLADALEDRYNRVFLFEDDQNEAS